jgi:hypothetical protein
MSKTRTASTATAKLQPDGQIDLRQPRLFTGLVGKVHEQRTRRCHYQVDPAKYHDTYTEDVKKLRKVSADQMSV